MRIGIEGSCLAGKTSVLKLLATRRPSLYACIEEYVVYAGGTSRFPSFPPKNALEALQSFRFFLKLEKQRQMDAERWTNSHVVLFDRTIFSLVAFEYAARVYSEIDILPQVLSVLEEHRMWWPDKVVVLTISAATILSRQENVHGKRRPMFVAPLFNRLFQDFLATIDSQFGVSVVKVNAEQPLEVVCDTVYDHLIGS